jgi:transcriptional regulator with XRE-family HTH domain
MSFFDRLEFLLSQKGLKPYALIDATGILKSTLYSWKKSGVSPSLETCSTIADFLEISLDELAGRTPPSHTEQELHLLNMFKKLPDAQKQEVINYVDFICSK